MILEGFMATVIQHEFDHLDGILYVDRIKDMRNLSYNEEYIEFNLDVMVNNNYVSTSTYTTPLSGFYEKTRRREVVRPRQVIMYLLREDFNISYPTIGSKLGGRDHTTVIHSCEKIKREIVVDNDLIKDIQNIRTLLV